MPLPELTVAGRATYNYGTGVLLATGDAKNHAVDGEPSGVADAIAAVVSMTISRIETTEELERALNVDAEASYGCASFGAGISARFKFASDIKVQSTALFLVVKATVQLNDRSIRNPKLSKAACEVIGRPEVFTQRYGNMFVRSIARGGLFVGCYRIETSANQTAESISAELKGSYGAFSAEASTRIRDIANKYQSQIYIDVYHEGGPVNLKINDTSNPNEILRCLNEFLDSFKADPEGAARPYAVVLAPLSIAEGPLPPNTADMEKAQDVLKSCAKARSRLLDRMNQLEYMLDKRAFYNFAPGDEQALGKSLANFQTDLDLVSECASAAINSPSSAKQPGPFAAAKGVTYPVGAMPERLPLPDPKYVLKEVPDFKGCPDRKAIERLATERGIQAKITLNLVNDAPWQVTAIDPPPGGMVPIDRAVSVFVTDNKRNYIDWTQKRIQYPLP